MRTRNALSITALTGVCALMTGCADPQPTVMADPTIVWENDNTPSSPLEDNKWVKALREYTLGIAMARNTGDYTIKQLTDHVSYERLAISAKGYAEQGNRPKVYLGPAPFQPVDVYELPDGSGAALTLCVFDNGPDMTTPVIDNGIPEPAPHERTAHLSTSYIMKDEATGELQTVGNTVEYLFPKEVWIRGDDPCDAASIPVGYFDPRPQLPPTPVTKPVREPIPEDEPPSWKIE